MVPSSPANRKWVALPPILKSVVALNAIPVGTPVPPPAPGTVTTRVWVLPVPSYRVDSPAPLSDTHHGPDGEATIPQGLTRLASAKGLMPAMSELRMVGWVLWAWAGK